MIVKLASMTSKLIKAKINNYIHSPLTNRGGSSAFKFGQDLIDKKTKKVIKKGFYFNTDFPYPSLHNLTFSSALGIDAHNTERKLSNKLNKIFNITHKDSDTSVVKHFKKHSAGYTGLGLLGTGIAAKSITTGKTNE